MIQLHNLLFDSIGMLLPDEFNSSGYHIGEIFDSCHHLSPYSLFNTSLDFYQTRAKLLNETRCQMTSVPTEILPHEDEPDTIPFLIDRNYHSGLFHLTHPDFSVFNFLFDDDFNITALIDRSGCQTIPIESFANAPYLVVPRPDKFLDRKARAGVLSSQCY